MNAEQKQRAQSLLNEYRPGDDAPHVYHMAALLQELVDAPEPEPVAWMVKNGFVCSMIYRSKKDADNYAADQQKRHDLSGSLASFCVIPLYAAPPAPSVPDVANTFKRRAEEIVAMAVNRENYAKINRTIADLVTDIANAAEATTTAEAPADVARDSVASEPVGYLYTNLQGDCADPAGQNRYL